MATPHIWGFGSLKVRNSLYDVQFTNAFNNLNFIKQSLRQRSITGKLYQFGLRYRPIITSTITTCNETDVGELQQLLLILSNYQNDPLYVYANYNKDNTQNIQYQMLLDNDSIELQNIANIKVGQTIQLTFIGSYNYDYIPIYRSDVNIVYMIDQSGNTYLDQSNNKYIMNT